MSETDVKDSLITELEAKVEGLEKENEHLTEIVEHNKISSTMMNRKVEGLEKQLANLDKLSLSTLKRMQRDVEEFDRNEH